MSKFLAFLTLLLGVALSSTGAVAAQTPTAGVDVAAIGEAVLAADPAVLVTALATPPDDTLLPAGFANPAEADTTGDELAQAFVLPENSLDGELGALNHTFATDPAIVPGLLSYGYLNYMVTDHQLTGEDLDKFERLAAGDASMATPGIDAVATVERIDVAGTEAVKITVVTSLSGIGAGVQMVAVPVGNTLVIGTVLSANQGESDPAPLLPFAEALALAGVQHLGNVATSGA